MNSWDEFDRLVDSDDPQDRELLRELARTRPSWQERLVLDERVARAARALRPRAPAGLWN